MNLEQWLVNLGTLGLLISGLAYNFFLKNYLKSYLDEKGKNLATKDDIGEITEIVENIKADLSAELAMLKYKTNLKKDVYMEAVVAMSINFNAIANMQDLSIPSKELGAQIGSQGSRIAKIQVVGDQKTIDAVNDFMFFFAEEFLELSLTRSTLLDIQNKIAFSQGLLDKSNKKVEEYIALVEKSALMESANSDALNLLTQIQQNEEINQNNLLSRIEALASDKDNLHLNFAESVLESTMSLQTKLAKAVLYVRNELSLPIDEESYLSKQQEHALRLKSRVEKFYGKVVETTNS